MNWDGVILSETVKESLYSMFVYDIDRASTMGNKEYAVLLKKKYNNSGQNSPNKGAFISTRTDGITIRFREPFPKELDGDDRIEIPWSMAARHIRAWECEKNDGEDSTMARKLQFDTAIAKDMQSAASDSFMDNIKMIDIKDIEPSGDNFYEISDIDLLADDIEREGLKHNLVVAKKPDGSGYLVKSGHRRLAAVKLLIEQKRRSNTKVACYVDGSKTQAESQLDLIMLNATQRKYTDADIMREYEELERTFKALETEGKPLKGRMRENIAAALKVSPAQVGKIENIKHNAIPEVEKAVKSGEMSISTANEVAKLPEMKQQEIVKEQPDISHKDVKEIQKQEKPPVPPKGVDEDVFEDDFGDGKEDVESEADEKAEMNAPSTGKQPIKTDRTFTLTFKEAEALLTFLDDWAEGEDEVAGIWDKLKNFFDKS